MGLAESSSACSLKLMQPSWQLHACKPGCARETPYHSCTRLHCCCSQYNAAVNKAMDVDTVEVQVDDVMRKVMQNLYSATQLGEHELQTELHSLEEAVNQSCGGGDGAMLSLALNSLQRLHANQIKMEESEDEEEEEQGADAMDVSAHAAMATKGCPGLHTQFGHTGVSGDHGSPWKGAKHGQTAMAP